MNEQTSAGACGCAGTGAGEAPGAPAPVSATVGNPESAQVFDALRDEFFDLARLLRRNRFMPVVSIDGLTPTEARAVHMVMMAKRRASEKPVRPGFVAALLHVTPSAFSQVLKSLEGKGLVERERGGDDFRAVAINLTPAGLCLAREVDAVATSQAHALIEYVGEENFRALLRTMRLIVEYQAQLSDGAEAGARPEGACERMAAGSACESAAAAGAPAGACKRAAAPASAGERAAAPASDAPAPREAGEVPCA
ncbi:MULTISPECIES: MarR family winged helix-turn-helix transcriptional regulator [unclassified Adlercreutzia]|uniref:MarR family winged helix-turn-helix transcriptional regulator n=1 Tax=unclassified Adlercreutzia TaxID=2636013 RepID=UPI0013E9C1DD|nr:MULTISPECIES: MarR family winged helix-turn-helix transcriptional regulator [unclassified Adlercreutzia]